MKQILIIVLTISTPFIHELGHKVGYSIEHIDTRVFYNTIHILNSTRCFWGILCGPLCNLIISLVALILSYINKSLKVFWSIIAMVFAISRLVTYIFISLFYFWNKYTFIVNDEGKVAYISNLPIILPYIIFSIVFICILRLLKLNFKDEKKEYKNLILTVFIYNLLFLLIMVISTELI